MYKKQILLIFLVVLTLLSFASCNSKGDEDKSDNILDSTVSNNKEYQKNLFAMDTYMTFKAYGPDAEKALDYAVNKVSELEKLLSVTDENSEIYKINSNSGSSVTVSDTVTDLINESVKFGNQTDGAFDISIYPVAKEWGFTTGDYKVPKQEILDSLLENVGYDKIGVDAENSTVTLLEGMKIDLGGIAKGYAGQQAADLLRSSGVKSAIINMGGNVQTVGSKYDSTDWKVAIKDPNDENKYIGYVTVSDKAVITSGGYERYFKDDDGNIWWHILNPKTAYPADSGIVSVTVIGDDGMMCDVLSTSLFVMGIEKSSDYWRKHGGFEAVLVTNNNELYVTSGLKNNFVSMDNFSNAKINIID